LPHKILYLKTEKINSGDRNYNTISPSAKSLLLLKGYTDIPFARAAAALISLPEKYEHDFGKKDFAFWARALHFENRYRSINQLLAGLKITNILELSSGFSFRGLAAIQDNAVHYIDTDLPDLINTKQSFIADLQDKTTQPKGRLELIALNALDKQEFKKVIYHFPAGEITIVNEGLLVYLDTGEKKKLCAIIRDTLRERGGYWITADIYIKPTTDTPSLKMNDKLERFFEEQHIRENMFESFESAEAFFMEEGFVIDKEAEPEYANAGSLKYLRESASEDQLKLMNKGGRIQTTWRLKLAGRNTKNS